MAQNDFALIIGVEDYPDYQSLQGSINDAVDVHKWVLKTDGGAVPLSQARLIKSTSKPPTPFQKIIDDELKIIKDTIEQNYNRAARRLYFYFSGHGLAMEQDDNSLCMADWSLDMRNSAISSREYLNYLVNTGYFEEVIFLLDCCRNRLTNHRGHFPNLGVPRPGANAGKTKTLIIYATEYQYSAYESQNEEMSEVRGYFTSALLKALNGEINNGNGTVTGKALVDFVKVETPRLAQLNNQSQEAVPVVNIDLDSLVFSNKKPKSKPVCTITFTGGRKGKIQLESDRDDIIRTDDVSTGPWEIALSPGLHLLTELDTQQEKGFKVLPEADNQTFQF